jgi:hypothetical protein
MVDTGAASFRNFRFEACFACAIVEFSDTFEHATSGSHILITFRALSIGNQARSIHAPT